MDQIIFKLIFVIVCFSQLSNLLKTVRKKKSRHTHFGSVIILFRGASEPPKMGSTRLWCSITQHKVNESIEMSKSFQYFLSIFSLVCVLCFPNV